MIQSSSPSFSTTERNLRLPLPIPNYVPRHKCKTDFHCQDKDCPPPTIGKCISKRCFCRIGVKEQPV
ncbi:hypothetical protein P8452_57654 [Trifolium repens]|nr:hypothetical protein P8452_57654 [Trifolium repens]